MGIESAKLKLGDKIRSWRMRLWQRPKDAAPALGMKPDELSRIEGAHRTPSIGRAAKLAEPLQLRGGAVVERVVNVELAKVNAVTHVTSHLYSLITDIGPDRFARYTSAVMDGATPEQGSALLDQLHAEAIAAKGEPPKD